MKEKVKIKVLEHIPIHKHKLRIRALDSSFGVWVFEQLIGDTLETNPSNLIKDLLNQKFIECDTGLFVRKEQIDSIWPETKEVVTYGYLCDVSINGMCEKTIIDIGKTRTIQTYPDTLRYCDIDFDFYEFEQC